MDFIVNAFNSFVNWLGSVISGGAGFLLCSLGQMVEIIAMIGIAVGLFCIMFKITKVIRYSLLGWLVGITLQVLGIALAK